MSLHTIEQDFYIEKNDYSKVQKQTKFSASKLLKYLYN
jgi:hypothetical protein